MALNLHDVDIAVRAGLNDTSLTNLVPLNRIWARVPMEQLLFPFIRMTQTGQPPETGVMDTPVVRVWNVGYDLMVFSQRQTNEEVAAALKALCDLMEDEANFTAEFDSRSMSLLASIPVISSRIEYDAQRTTYLGIAEYRLMIQEA